MRLAVELPVAVFQIVNITARAKETIKWKDLKNISPISCNAIDKFEYFHDDLDEVIRVAKQDHLEFKSD